MTEPRPRPAGSSAMLPSVRTGRDPSDAPTQRAHVSELLKVPLRHPLLVRASIAAATAFVPRGLLAGGAWLGLLLAVAALLDLPLAGIEPEGRRRVVAMGPEFLRLAGLAGAVSVVAWAARRRIDGAKPDAAGALAWLRRSMLVVLGLPVAAGVAAVAFRGLAAGAAAISDSTGLLRVAALSSSALVVATMGVLAMAVAYVSAIAAIEGCPASEAGAVLSGLARRAAPALALHFGVIALFAGGAWSASHWAAERVWALAGPGPAVGTLRHALLDGALFQAAAWTPGAALLGALAVSSWLLLRESDVTTPLPLDPGGK